MAALEIVTLGNVATPFTAATVCGAKLAPPGFAPSARMTVPVNEGTGLPCPSSAVTATLNELPATTLADGCVVNTSCVAPSRVWVHGWEGSPEDEIVNVAGPCNGSVAVVCA